MTRRIVSRTPVVLHLISSLKIGGAERLLVSTMLAARGNPALRFVVVVMNEAVDPGLMAELRASGFPVYHFARPEGHLHPRYLAQILRIVGQHDVDVIHAHNEGSRLWGMLAKLARPGLKLVYTQHEQGGAGAIHGLKRIAYRLLVDMTVAISPFIAEETRALSGKRVVTIENGIDLRKFRRAPRRHDPVRPVRIVHVGRIVRLKGQDILIDAVHACVARGLDVECTLVGAPSDGGFLAELEAQIARLGLGSRVRFEIGRTDIETIFADQDIFVLPSREEGFGIAIIEAMAAGLPVVVAAVGGARNIVQHGENGLLFERGSASGLADGVMALINDPALGARLAASGALAAQRFDIQRAIDAQVALYRALVSGALVPALAPAARGAHGVEASALRDMP